MDSALERVEKFVQGLHELDFVISKEAKEIPIELSSVHKGEKYSCSLAEVIYKMVLEYESLKIFEGTDEAGLRAFALSALVYIDKAYAYGVIQPSGSLLGKLEKCKQEKTQLEKEFNALSGTYLQLRKDFEEFKKHVGLTTNDDWRKKDR